MSYNEITTCRSCGSTDLELVLSLGDQYVVDFPVQKDENALQAPLDLVLCRQDGLLQLKHSVDKDRLFKTFWYRSGINESMRAALRDVVTKTVAVAHLEPGDKVLDIGSNDGTMLGMFPSFCKTVGIDPCSDVVEDALNNKRLDVGIKGYFTANAVRQFGPFKAITAIAMFYDLENPKQFLRECQSVLVEDGVIVIQMNYLATMLRDMAIDNISHEHLCYYSFTTLKALVESVGLTIVGAETNSVNGGSLRVYVMNRGHDIKTYRMLAQARLNLYTNTLSLLQDEARQVLCGVSVYHEFARRASNLKHAILYYLQRMHDQGQRIYLYGASTRGTALTQYLELNQSGKSYVRGVAERDRNKFGRLMVGTWAPIKSEAECHPDADLYVVLPWHFKEAIVQREREWLEKGGKMLFPLPVPHVVTKDEVFYLLADVTNSVVGGRA